MSLNQSGIVELNNALMEAMVLLDPPFLNRPSTLTCTNVTKAHDMLISAANDLDMNTYVERTSFITASLDNNDGDGDGDGDEGGTGRNGNTTIIVADLFRALILSSTLLLEMCPWQEGEEETGGKIINKNTDENMVEVESAMNLSSDSPSTTSRGSDIYLSELDVKRLYRTVRQSILLLQLLSRFAQLASSTTSACANSHQCGDNISDWHDELLPRSQYPLLQECFQRKELMDVEDNVVFGMEDRLISLNVQDYMYEYEEGQYGHDGMETESEMGETNNYAQGDEYVAGEATHYDIPHSHINGHSVNRNRNIGTDFDEMAEADADAKEQAISLSLDPNQLRTEEDILLDIAFPETENTPHNKHACKRQRKNKAGIANQNSSKRTPSPSIQHRLKQDGLLQFILLPFDQTCYIVKEGWLILRACEIQRHKSVQKDAGTSDLSCYIYLFSNGFLCFYTNTMGFKAGLGLATDPKNENQLLHAFSISAASSSKPTMVGTHKTFHFTIDELEERRNKAEKCDMDHRMASIVLGVDEEQGGGLTDGYNWMMTMNQCSKETKEFEQLREAIKQQWKS